MRSYQKRLLFVVVISLCVVGFFSVSMPDVSFAGGNHGTIGGGPTSYDDGGSSDDDSSGHVKKPKKPHKHWYTSGNKYIDPENYFLGTTDAADLVIRTDNIERVRVTTEGNVGIGTYTPTGTLHVEGGIAEGTTDGTDITLKAQDGGPGGGAGGNIVLAPGTGIMTDEFGNPIPSTDEFGNPILDEFGNPVPVTKNGEVIVKGNIAPAVDDVSSLGTPELRYKNIFMGSNFNYLDDGLFYRYQFWNVRLEPPDWDYINRVVFTWDGKVGIGTDLPTEMLHVEGGGAKISGNVDAASYTGDGSALSGVVTSEADPAFTASAASSITSAGSGVVISAAERTTLGTALQSYTESDPDYNGSAASSITSAGSGVVMSAAERTTLGTALQSYTESDPDYNGSAASGITSAGSGVVISAAERTTLGTALQSYTESDPDYNGSAASGITSAGSGVVMSAAERTTLGTALQSFTELDPDYNGSAASGITSAGSGVVMSAAERTTLGTALQSYTESDPTVTLTKLENLVVDFHTLGGVDQFVDADADSANEIQTIDRTDNEITLSNGGGTVSVADSDNDSANELITGAALVGTDLQLTDAGGTKSVSLSSFVDSGDPSYGSSASSPTNGVFIDNGGNIGISDTTPSYKLDVNGTMSASRFYDRDNTSYYVNPYGTSNLRALNINFDYGARLNLRSAGDTYSNSVYSNFQQLWLTNSNAESIVFLTGTTVGSATGRLTISNAGNVGIPSANAAYKLNVIGTVYASGAAGALSDIRHKKNVQPVSDGMLDIIDNLRPVTYEWKDPSDSGMQGTQIGFIAQEVESVLPEIVLTQEDEDKTKGLKYNEFIPVLVKAMKELKGENDLLKQDVKEVKAENSQLRELISTLTARQDSFEAIVFAKSTNQNERLAKLDEKAINTK